MSKKIKASPSLQAPEQTHWWVTGTYIPCPNYTRLGEGQRELCSTFDLAHPLSIKSLNVLGDVTAFTSSPAQFPKSPSPQENNKPRFKNIDIRPASHNIPPAKRGVRQDSPSSVRARVCASLLPHATWITLWPRRTFTYSITNLKTESSTGTKKARGIFPHRLKANTAHI